MPIETDHPLKHAALFSGLAFGLHLGWELVQCPLFFLHGSFDASLSGMLRAALGDVLISWMLYALVALASRRWRWARGVWPLSAVATLVLAGTAIAIGVEWYALETGRWAYAPGAPRLPRLGVSALPVMQLVLIVPLASALSERLLRPAAPGVAERARQAGERYDRIAWIYDLGEAMMEIRAARFRRELWAGVAGDALELGVGTGKSIACYPSAASVIAVDVSPRMLERARRRARRLGRDVELVLADAGRLPYADASFDCVVATFLLCSVPDPEAVLREARRLLRPGGRLLLVEHVLSEKPLLRPLMRLLDPVVFHLWGAHVDRETQKSVERAGFARVATRDLSLDVVKRIEAFR